MNQTLKFLWRMSNKVIKIALFLAVTGIWGYYTLTFYRAKEACEEGKMPKIYEEHSTLVNEIVIQDGQFVIPDDDNKLCRSFVVTFDEPVSVKKFMENIHAPYCVNVNELPTCTVLGIEMELPVETWYQGKE